MQPTGLARTETEVQDLSFLISGGTRGIIGVQGVTEFGEPQKPRLVGSWIEYQRYFGGLLSGSLFPLLCKRALDKGAKLYVSRAAHYSVIADNTTIEGVKASGSIVLGVTGTSVWTAKNIGEGGNKITVAITTGDTGKVNIKVTVKGFTGEADLTHEEKAFPNTPTAQQKIDLNNKLKFVQLGAITTLIAPGSITLAGGSQSIAAIVATDYIGNQAARNGLYAFDGVAEISKIAVPEKALPEIDAAISTYVTMRGDLMGLVRTPVGLDGATVVNYRKGTGIYAHAAIDNWRVRMFTGGLIVKDPLSKNNIEIPELGDVIGLLSKRDNIAYPWYSESGARRGKIADAIDVVYNFGTSGRQTEGGNIVDNGVTPVINHESFGVVAWGNRTLQLEDTLLKKAEVAELLLFIIKGLKPLVQVELFEPNDINTWKSIYRKVKPFMANIATNRGVNGEEGEGWVFEGDQNIDSISEIQVNTPQNIDLGFYVFNLMVKPITALEYIGIKVSVHNSGVDFSLSASV